MFSLDNNTILVSTLAGAVARFVVQALIYGPVLGKAWIKGMDQDKSRPTNVWMKEGYPMPLLFGSSFLLSGVEGAVYGALHKLAAPETPAAVATLAMGVAALKCAQQNNQLWAGRPQSLIAIQTVDNIFCSITIGFVLFFVL